MSLDETVGVGFMAEESLHIVGACLKKVYPVDETPCFDDLIRALDRADCTSKPNWFTDWFGYRKSRGSNS